MTRAECVSLEKASRRNLIQYRQNSMNLYNFFGKNNSLHFIVIQEDQTDSLNAR